jgi:hypothetical protein
VNQVILFLTTSYYITGRHIASIDLENGAIQETPHASSGLMMDHALSGLMMDHALSGPGLMGRINATIPKNSTILKSQEVSNNHGCDPTYQFCATTPK